MSTKIKELNKSKTLDEIRAGLGKSKISVDPDFVLKEADKELSNKKEGQFALTPENSVFRAMSVLEFDTGILMSTVIPEQYRSLAIDMMRQLQKEFDCHTASEKATAELAAVNYIRTLEVQNRITRYVALGTISENGVKFLAIMSNELDRANRHYLTTIQALKTMKQPHLELNIKTNTTVIGQNQVVQTNNNLNDS